MKVAIAGFGAEGKASYDYWLAKGDDVTIVDENDSTKSTVPYGAKSKLGNGAFGDMNGFDMVVRTAGLAPNKITTDGTIWSATNEFFAQCPVEIVGVTGTKGKGTTSSIIASIFEASGRRVHLVGNIGVPALTVLPNIHEGDIVVFEMSSFQLWDMKRSPHVAVVLLIEPDHLNVHYNMQDYLDAKANICKHQVEGDVCIYHPSNELSASVAATSSHGGVIRYGVSTDGGVYDADGYFYQNEQKICPTEALQLLGRHNVENACAAITVAKSYGLDDGSIEAGLRNFKGLPHRLEHVRSLAGVDFFNDSFSSAPSATMAAIASFNQPEIVILGGIDKGADFSGLATALVERKNIKQILLVGEIRHKLGEILGAHGIPADLMQILDVKTMAEIVDISVAVSEEGDVVILSPACASFDMFRDFCDRGDQFRSIVSSL